MAQHNQISVILTDEAMREIMDAIAVMQRNLPFLINMTLDERRTHLKMGDRSFPFVGKSLDYSKSNDHLVPPFLNVTEFDKDMMLISKLNIIERPLLSLTEGISDTKLRAGSEAYSAALLFYQAVKLAAQMNIPGVKTIYEDLRARFPSRGAQRPSNGADENGNDAFDEDLDV
ncbi:MAG: hypothetical protein SFU99_00880 [Saprospiraceae bacterium]|nr:hypothetical protein [Saprospiraceae bacterium]